MTPFDHARLAAAANGVDFEQLVVIQDTNNVVAWLQPTSVIVKVGRWSHSAPGLQLEYVVDHQLGDLGAPICCTGRRPVHQRWNVDGLDIVDPNQRHA